MDNKDGYHTSYIKTVATTYLRTVCTRCGINGTASRTQICFGCWEKLSEFTRYFILRNAQKEKKVIIIK